MNTPFNQSKNKIRVLLITPFQIIHESLKILIEDNSDMCVLDPICNSKKISEEIDLSNLDVGLIYLQDKDVETIEIISRLLDGNSKIRIIVVTNEGDFGNQTRAIQLGAVGIVQKEQNARILIEAIRQTHRGETWINQILLSKLLKGKDSQNNVSRSSLMLKAQNLTPREKEVIKLIGNGYKNKDIADFLNISEATVRHHLSSIYGKTGVEDRLNLVIYAYQHGLIDLSEEISTKASFE